MASRSIAMCQASSSAIGLRQGNRGKSKAFFGGVLSCSLLLQSAIGATAIAQSPGVPQPIQNQTFATQLPTGLPATELPQQSALLSAQAFERVGKQLSPSRPTGRTTLQRGEESLWLQRLLRPRKPSGDQPKQQAQPQAPQRSQAGRSGKQIPVSKVQSNRSTVPSRQVDKRLRSSGLRIVRGYQAGSRYDSRSGMASRSLATTSTPRATSSNATRVAWADASSSARSTATSSPDDKRSSKKVHGPCSNASVTKPKPERDDGSRRAEHGRSKKLPGLVLGRFPIIALLHQRFRNLPQTLRDELKPKPEPKRKPKPEPKRKPKPEPKRKQVFLQALAHRRRARVPR